MSGVAPGKPVEYHVLKHGEMFGPFTEEQLRAGLSNGRFEAHDFVQVEGYVVWRPLVKVLESSGGSSGEEVKGAVAPDWPTILKWAWLRLRYNLDEQAAQAGAVCLVLGCLALTLSHWPFIFWAPWFVAALFAAVGLFRNKHEAHGALLLAGIILLPSLLYFFGPRSRPSAPAAEAAPTSVVVERVETVPATALPAPQPVATAPAVTVPAPAPTALVEMPAPAPASVVTVAPPPNPVPASPLPVHPAPAPAASATPATTPSPAPSSLLEEAGKFANSLSPLIAGAKAALPSQLPTLPKLPNLPSFPFTSTPTASTEAPSDTETAQAAFIQNHMDAFVIVKGSNGSGSGFIARFADKTYLFSNIHVVSEVKQPLITRLDGVTIPVGPGEVAGGADIARLTLPAPPPHPLEVTSDFDHDVHIGDEVVVLGNSGGGGVVTSLKGKVVGVGPDRLEVDAEFIPGNSGSPIIHVKSGKVIGIATYLTRRYEEFAPNNTPQSKPAPNGGPGAVVVRRFGYRIDKVPTWEPANWPELSREADQIEEISKLTEDIFHFLSALRNDQEPNFATDTLRRPATDWLTKIRASHVSSSDRLSATQGMLSALRMMVQGDVAATAATLRYTYFRNRLQDEKQVRDRLYKAFDSKLTAMSSPLSRHR